ncbi:hypothetical protein TNCV_4829421 [Trichonephila clavipes]|nr:hypothetical protein TNCV_4829421 [Trichonephila clavipes]
MDFVILHCGQVAKTKYFSYISLPKPDTTLSGNFEPRWIFDVDQYLYMSGLQRQQSSKSRLYKSNIDPEFANRATRLLGGLLVVFPGLRAVLSN